MLQLKETGQNKLSQMSFFFYSRNVNMPKIKRNNLKFETQLKFDSNMLGVLSQSFS